MDGVRRVTERAGAPPAKGKVRPSPKMLADDKVTDATDEDPQHETGSGGVEHQGADKCCRNTHGRPVSTAPAMPGSVRRATP